MLDAQVLSVIKDNVFRAQLANGHELVAYAGRSSGVAAAGVRIGDRVSVALSPYDMSQGRIVLEDEAEHESAQLSQTDL
ncbi:MAG: translation initiation factor IF-1 [Kiritimatiellaeota bacterium]|nr:translation initiation factor IF-1 [Kiritimatiellota bacterium]